MPVRVHNIELSLDEDPSSLGRKAAERLGLPLDRVRGWRIARRSIDARGPRVRFICSVDATLDDSDAETLASDVTAVEESVGITPEVPSGVEEVRGRVIVVGCGPAGLLAALRLAEHGYRPLLIERGHGVMERCRRVESFLRDGRLDPESNILYGAGGAGTFSDGKLRTRTKDRRIPAVLRLFVEAGAPEEVLYDSRPHVGTDRLRAVVGSLCRQLIARGGEIAWNTRVTRIETDGQAISALHSDLGATESNAVILAAGPYARDSMDMLLRAGAEFEAKPFQMGLRIEHPQEIIDRAVYGDSAGHRALGAADYALTSRGSHGVTSFCVCPGGAVVPAMAAPRTLCTNGMSPYARNTGLCNGALVATVMPEHFGGSGPLAGLVLQRRYEEAGYALGGGSWKLVSRRSRDATSTGLQRSPRAAGVPAGGGRRCPGSDGLAARMG